jgi:hypothetical protein
MLVCHHKRTWAQSYNKFQELLYFILCKLVARASILLFLHITTVQLHTFSLLPYKLYRPRGIQGFWSLYKKWTCCWIYSPCANFCLLSTPSVPPYPTPKKGGNCWELSLDCKDGAEAFLSPFLQDLSLLQVHGKYLPSVTAMHGKFWHHQELILPFYKCTNCRNTSEGDKYLFSLVNADSCQWI